MPGLNVAQQLRFDPIRIRPHENLRAYSHDAGRKEGDIGIDARMSMGRTTAREWRQEVEAWRHLGVTHITLNTAFVYHHQKRMGWGIFRSARPCGAPVLRTGCRPIMRRGKRANADDKSRPTTDRATRRHFASRKNSSFRARFARANSELSRRRLPRPRLTIPPIPWGE
jgi:hypothetical protein